MLQNVHFPLLLISGVAVAGGQRKASAAGPRGGLINDGDQDEEQGHAADPRDDDTEGDEDTEGPSALEIEEEERMLHCMEIQRVTRINASNPARERQIQTKSPRTADLFDGRQRRQQGPTVPTRPNPSQATMMCVERGAESERRKEMVSCQQSMALSLDARLI